MTKATDQAAKSAEPPADLLRDAWEKAYGLHPDPDSAYRQAVRAVEALACELVLPTDALATPWAKLLVSCVRTVINGDLCWAKAEKRTPSIRCWR